MRTVSVLPSATEIVSALGAGELLVGRSAECDYPEEVRRLPVVMRPRAEEFDRPSAEIDQRVRASLRAGESLYDLDLDQLAKLRPDLLLTQDLCRVCSVTDAEARTACELAGVSPRILSLSPRSLDDVWDSIRTIGRALDRTDAAEALVGALRTRTPAGRASSGRRVLVLEWIDPPIEAGLWTADLIRSAGARPWSTEGHDPAHPVSLAAVREDPPDLVIVSPCSFSVPRTLAELRRAPNAQELAKLPVPSGIWIADEAHFSRPGPRVVEGRELIARLLAGRGPSGALPVAPWVPENAAAGS